MTHYMIWFYPAAVCFALAGWLSVHEFMVHKRNFNRWIGSSILMGAGYMAFAIAGRWIEAGHGPFLTMFEVLLSNLFSLALIYGIAYALFPTVRAGAPVVTGIILLLFFWTCMTNNGLKPLPPTYETPWLWAHVVAGKLFLGCCLITSSLAAPLLMPTCRFRLLLSRREITLGNLESNIWRWLSLAFVFHSMMLIAGAVWAQDAWGRFWSWDPLETWAFATWLVMAAGLHARSTLSMGLRASSAIAVGTFVLAFLTFFGVPFISMSPHQGAV